MMLPLPPEFTSEELYQQAQGNVTAFVLAIIAHFKESGQKPDEWVTFHGVSNQKVQS